MGFKAREATVWSFFNGLFREPDGTPSVTRTLLIAFSCFDMWAIWRILYHLLHTSDNAVVSTWLGNMPMLIGALIALASMPYAINRGTTTMSDLAGMIGKKADANNSNVTKAVEVVDQQIATRTTTSTSTPVAAAPAPATPDNAPGTGSDGEKG